MPDHLLTGQCRSSCMVAHAQQPWPHLRTSTWRPFSEGRPSSHSRSPLGAKLTAPSRLVCRAGGGVWQAGGRRASMRSGLPCSPAELQAMATVDSNAGLLAGGTVWLARRRLQAQQAAWQRRARQLLRPAAPTHRAGDELAGDGGFPFTRLPLDRRHLLGAAGTVGGGAGGGDGPARCRRCARMRVIWVQRRVLAGAIGRQAEGCVGHQQRQAG